MDSQSGTNQLGYYSRNYGWVGPEFASKTDIDILNSTIKQSKFKNLDTDIILLRSPEIHAVLTEYDNRINLTEGGFGLAVFEPTNWRYLSVLHYNTPYTDASYNAMLDIILKDASNVPVKIQYGNEIVTNAVDVNVKVKKIDFNGLQFPSGLPLLKEFAEYVKNGNKREYDEGDFISVLNDAVIFEQTLPPLSAEMLMGKNMIRENMYEHELTHVEPTETNQIISEVTKSILSIAASFYEPADLALSTALAIGGLVNDIVNATDVNKLMINEQIPNGKIVEYKCTKDDYVTVVTNLDYIHLYSQSIAPIPLGTFRWEGAQEVISSDLKTITEAPNVILDLGALNTTIKFASDITKHLLKNIRLDQTIFFQKSRQISVAQGIGYPGFILAGDELEPDDYMEGGCNYKSYVHKNDDFFGSRIYCQYKFNLNLHDLLKPFSEPGQAGDWLEDPGFNAVYIDDRPFAFYVGDEWFYTRYSTDLPM